MSLFDTPVLNHKNALMTGIVESFEDASLEYALTTVLSYHNVEDLERMWPTITKRPMPVRPKGYQEDFMRTKKELRDVGVMGTISVVMQGRNPVAAATGREDAVAEALLIKERRDRYGGDPDIRVLEVPLVGEPPL